MLFCIFTHLTHTPAFSTVKSFTSPRPKVPPTLPIGPTLYPGARSGPQLCLAPLPSVHLCPHPGYLAAQDLESLISPPPPPPWPQAPRSRCLPSRPDHRSAFCPMPPLLHCPVSRSPVDGVRPQFWSCLFFQKVTLGIFISQNWFCLYGFYP